MKRFLSSVITGVWSSLLIVLVIFLGFAIGLVTWSADFGRGSLIAAAAAVLIGFCLLFREYAKDAARERYRPMPDEFMRDLQLCLEPVFKRQPDFRLEYPSRRPYDFDPFEDDRTRQRRRDIMTALTWAVGTIFLTAGIILLVVAVLTRAGLPKGLMPTITLISIGASLVITRLYHEQLPNLTAKVAFFAGVAVLPPTLIQFIFFNSSS